MRFEGVPAEAMEWFRGLEEDNSKAYFEAARAQYERAVRGPLEALLTELAGEFGGTVKLFRQNRDVRFSADKRPYKTTAYGILHQRVETEAGLYAQISAEGLWAGTGYHQMAPDQIERFRLAVARDGDGEELVRIVSQVEDLGLEIGGEMLARTPRGFPRDHPRADLLCFKELKAGRGLEPGPVLSSRRALTYVAQTWHVAEPLNAWLDEHVGASGVPPEVRWGGAAMAAARSNR